MREKERKNDKKNTNIKKAFKVFYRRLMKEEGTGLNAEL